MNSSYERLLSQKRTLAPISGFEVDERDLNPMLFPFQRKVTAWAIQRGKAALFLDTGLGKTACLLAWADFVYQNTGLPVLIFAPLAVTGQTQREGKKFGYDVTVCREQFDVKPGINVTNYQRIHRFDNQGWGGLVIDESSVLKGDGPTRKGIIDFASAITYRLACTATPAPNELLELANHAEYLGIMEQKEITATFFSQKGNSTHNWQLKAHAKRDWWSWVASWAAACRKPSDWGYSDEGYILPGLHIHERVVETPLEFAQAQGVLFEVEARGETAQRRVRRSTISDRVREAVSIVSMGQTGRICDKLAVCGNQNTPRTDARSINPIPANGSGASSSAELPMKTGSICQPTTKPTSRSGRRTGRKTETNAIDFGESDTPAMLNSGPSAALHPEPPASEPRRIGHCESSDLPLNNTMECSNDRETPALSAGLDIRTFPAGVSPLTTATLQEWSGVSSAQSATSELDSSEMTGERFNEPSTILEIGANEPWVIWCALDDEQRELEKAFGNLAFSVYGSLKDEEKERRLTSWLKGERPILITKLKIAGFGINMQHCANQIFCGIGNSHEQRYQGVRRSHRFGQKNPVHVYLIRTDADGQIVANLLRKELQGDELMDELILAVQREGLVMNRAARSEMDYLPEQMVRMPSWLKGVV